MARHVDDGAVDEDHVAIRIVTTDLALALVQETVIAHPVRELMRQPRAALRTVVIFSGRGQPARPTLSVSSRVHEMRALFIQKGLLQASRLAYELPASLGHTDCQGTNNAMAR